MHCQSLLGMFCYKKMFSDNVVRTQMVNNVLAVEINN